MKPGTYLLCLLCLAGGALIGVAALKFAGRAVDTDSLAQPARTERPCAPLSADTAIIVVHGQSNAGNYGSGRYAARGAVDNFDPETGKCFAAVDPLLGAGGTGASFATRLGDILIDAGRFKRVVVAPIAIGGVSIADLNSVHAGRIETLLARLRSAQLVPTHILFEQGETDTALTTTREQYVSTLHALVMRFRSAGFNAPFYVSQTTRCDDNGRRNVAVVRDAQLMAVDPQLDIRRGPDTDAIGDDGRRDGCHMNEAGTLANAALWAAFIGNAATSARP